VVAIVATLVTLKLTAAPAHLTASESARPPPPLPGQVTTVPAGVLDQAQPRTGCHPRWRQVPAGGPPLTIDGKPGIVFVSEESCPFLRGRALVARCRALVPLSAP